MSEIQVDLSSNEDSAVMQAVTGGVSQRGAIVGQGN